MEEKEKEKNELEDDDGDGSFGVGVVEVDEEEAKRISPMCAITPASSQATVGVRVAGTSPDRGGGGYGGAAKEERTRDSSAERVERSVSVLAEGVSSLVAEGVGNARYVRRTERKIGKAPERFLLRA